MYKKSVEEIIEAMESNDSQTRRIAMQSCAGRWDVPIDPIVKGTKDEYRWTQQYAFEACLGRNDVPTEVIWEGLASDNEEIRNIADVLLQEHGGAIATAKAMAYRFDVDAFMDYIRKNFNVDELSESLIRSMCEFAITCSNAMNHSEIAANTMIQEMLGSSTLGIDSEEIAAF